MTWKPNESSGRILGFDGLRAFAIIMVFLSHKTTIGLQLAGGAAGVMLFFVLSGFLITGILLNDRYRIEAGQSTVRAEIVKFFINRSFRIFPPYYAMLIILLIIAVIFHQRISLLWNATYFTYTTNIGIAYFEKTWAPLGHLWSLAVEEQFYILAAPLFLFTPLKHARLVVFGAWIVGALSFAIMKLTGAPDITYATDSFLNYAMLAIGSFLALNIKRGEGASSWLIILGLVLLVAPPGLGILFPALRAWQPFDAPNHIDILYAAMVIYGVVLNQKSAIVKLLDFTPLRLLGRVSYAFYLWHYAVEAKGLTPALLTVIPSPDLVHIIVVLIDFTATLALATASWWLLEAPMLRARDRLFRPTAQPVPATSAA